MNAAGKKNLGSINPITVALTDEVITASSLNGAATTYIGNLAGMTSLTVFANFDYGSGGATVAAIIQTSIDHETWIDIIRFDFTTADRKAHATVGVFAAGAVTALAPLASEGKLDNVLGDWIRAKVTSTNTYAGNTSLALRAVVR